MVLAAALGAVLAGWSAGLVPAGAEQASQPSARVAGWLDAGRLHTCAVVPPAQLRCWGLGLDGALGHGDTATIGDDEPPAAAGPVDVGAGRAVEAVSTGAAHTCALLDRGAVRCWGFGGDGRLGYASTSTIGDDEPPAAAGPVDLGVGRGARAISAGMAHTCAVLDDGAVRCWGFNSDGRLGYGRTDLIGDNEPPGSVGPVRLGAGRTALAIASGGAHTCAVLDDGAVRCWGRGDDGQLGYGSVGNVGDDETPDLIGPVDLGAGRRAVAIAAGDRHTCAVLDDGTVRCWGLGAAGRLGYANVQSIGDTETPAAAGPVYLGLGRTARAITAGDDHTCALLDDGGVRCWGDGGYGRLGYASQAAIGDDETPAAAGPVDLGAGRTALAISAGGEHTCARLDDGSVRCWGRGVHGRLGSCSRESVGDDETPGSAGPVDLGIPGVPAAPCVLAVPAPPAPPGPPAPLAPPPPTAAAALRAAKLSLARARILRRDRILDVFAPITSLASGRVRVRLRAAGMTRSFGVQLREGAGRIRLRRRIAAAQAQLATGILTLSYGGDADTRPQTVRLRAAARSAELRVRRPAISGGRLRAVGTVSRRARGVVRVQLQVVVGDDTRTHELRAPIRDGRWSLSERLAPAVRDAIARRSGTVHSYTLFTGDMRAGIRGEMRSFEVLGPR